MLFAELVLFSVRCGVAAQPELLDKLLAFLVGLEARERLALFIGDDVNDFLVEPLLIGSLEFLTELFLLLPFLLFRERLCDGLPLLALRLVRLLVRFLRERQDAKERINRAEDYKLLKPHRFIHLPDSTLVFGREQQGGGFNRSGLGTCLVFLTPDGPFHASRTDGLLNWPAAGPPTRRHCRGP